jgi:hypothetical protein
MKNKSTSHHKRINKSMTEWVEIKEDKKIVKIKPEKIDFYKTEQQKIIVTVFP